MFLTIKGGEKVKGYLYDYTTRIVKYNTMFYAGDSVRYTEVKRKEETRGS
jgi:hypothetical protein